MLAFLTMGGAIAYFGYQSTMYLLDKAIGFIARQRPAQTPEQLAEYIKQTQDLIPSEGNPVWLFPTPKTDFGLIQANLDSIVLRANIASGMDPLSESYNMAIIRPSSVSWINQNKPIRSNPLHIHHSQQYCVSRLVGS